MASYQNFIRIQKEAVGATLKVQANAEGAVLSLHRPFGDDCVASIQLSKAEAAGLLSLLEQGLKWPEPGWSLRNSRYDGVEKLREQNPVPGWISD